MRTRTVEVWRIEYAERHHVTGDWLPCTDTWPTEEYIRAKEEDLRGRSDVACIRVTGPHKQEVPVTGTFTGTVTLTPVK
jgi:hypothetical protein